MNRLALPATLAIVALGVLVMAQFASFALPGGERAHGITVVLTPAGTQGTAGAEPGVIEHLNARSGLVDYNELDRRLESLMDDPTMIGLAVAVVENGETVFARGYGETLNGSGEEVTVDTVFRWASLSKGVASTMVGLLAGDGAVDLYAPVSRYAPSLRLPGSGEMRITVADLLAHRTGLERNGHDMFLEQGEDPHVLRGRLTSYPIACAPGTCHRYQNVAYDAASEIVAGVTGESYETAVTRRLFAPLGMTSASMTMAGLFASPSWARSHKNDGTEEPVVQPYYSIPAAGGMNGSIRDLARWMEAQMGETPGIIPQAVLDTIHRPVVETTREDHRNRKYAGRIANTRYALGWRVYDYAGHTMIAHRGAVRGYRAMILFDPARRSGVVVVSNSNSGRPFSIPMDVFDQIYGLPDAHWTEAGAVAVPGRAEPAPVEPVDRPLIEGRRRPGTIEGPGAAR